MQSKAEGVPLAEEAEAPKEAEVVDLVAALRASVEAAKKRRGRGGAGQGDLRPPVARRVVAE